MVELFTDKQEIEKMTITSEDFTRIKNDTNGNPRYVTHYLNCMPECYRTMRIDEQYAATCKLMNKLGGRKYHNKTYGGGICFQSYSLDRDAEDIDALKAKTNAEFGKIPANRKYAKYERELLDAIDSDGFEDCAYFNDCSTDEKRASFSCRRFMSEHGWNVERIGLDEALSGWLAGLALNIPYMNDDILVLAGAENAPEKKQEKILENYWSFMSMRLQGVWRYYGII